MRKLIIIVCILVAVAVASYFFWEEYDEHRHKTALTLYGNVDVRQVDLGFRVPGRVNTLYFEEGDHVTPGTLMAVLDKQPYADEILEAKAAVASTKASLLNAKRILKRRQELIADGSVSQEDLDNSTANVEVLEANLKQAEATLAVAVTNLKFTEVYAPTEGTILTRIREPGTVVNPADPVYTLSVTSPVWIRAFVNEPELGLVYPNMRATVSTDTPGGKTYTGYVGFISPVAEFTPKTVQTTDLRTDLVYRLRIYADNPDQGLRQGMPVTVELHLKEEEK